MQKAHNTVDNWWSDIFVIKVRTKIHHNMQSTNNKTGKHHKNRRPQMGASRCVLLHSLKVLTCVPIGLTILMHLAVPESLQNHAVTPCCQQGHHIYIGVPIYISYDKVNCLLYNFLCAYIYLTIK